MNRSLAYVGLAVVLAGVSLVASPIVLTGREELDLAQIAGFLIAPVGLVVVMIAAASFDPERTTVEHTLGTYGGLPPARRPSGEPAVPPALANLRAPVHCRYCRTVITYDLARCPRCARDRPCRSCGRPLTLQDDQATCPGCTRPELFCNCSSLASVARGRSTRSARYP